MIVLVEAMNMPMLKPSVTAVPNSDHQRIALFHALRQEQQHQREEAGHEDHQRHPDQISFSHGSTFRVQSSVISLQRTAFSASLGTLHAEL